MTATRSATLAALAMPGDVEDRLFEWEQLTSEPWLFEELSRLVARGDAVELSNGERRLKQWWGWFRFLRAGLSSEAEHASSPLSRENIEACLGQAIRARALIWCAGRALDDANAVRDSAAATKWLTVARVAVGRIDPVVARFLNHPDHRAWTWVAIRTFLESFPNGDGAPPPASVTQAVAFADEAAGPSRGRRTRGGDVEDTGMLASLVLDVLPLDASTPSPRTAGAGVVAQHPADVWAWKLCASDFRASVDRAWLAACALHRTRQSSVPRADARWRLIGQPKDRSITGSSASGAAARGWYFALNRRHADPRTIVLAAVTSTEPPLIGGVGGVKAKTRAIEGAGRFDTIAVATARNALDAQNALGPRSAIRVVNVSSVREQL